MAERDAEIEELKVRIAALEARPAPDLEWLKNSNTFRHHEILNNPQGFWIVIKITLAVIIGSILFAYFVPPPPPEGYLGRFLR